MTRIPEPQKLIQHTAHKVTVVVKVEPELIFFPGHFPVQSVLPGVVMVDWAVSFAERFLPVTVEFTQLEAIKFKQVVKPPHEISIHLEFRPDTQKLLYKVDSALGEHSSGKISRVSLRAENHA